PCLGARRLYLLAPMNKLYVGFTKDIQLPQGGCLLIADEVPEIKKARIFDPLVHSFNPLKNIDHKTARQLADLLYTISPQGENTLTVRNGRRALARALFAAKRLDQLKVESKIKGIKEEVEEMIDDLLFSPILKHALCNKGKLFSFNPRSTILARVN